MSRSHPEQWAIRTRTDDAGPRVVEELSRFPTTQIADSGGPVGVVGPGIVPVTPTTEVCGTATTLWTKPGDILFLLKAPDLIQQGDVLVIDSGGRLDAAVIGDIFSRLVRDKGGVGIVVDGAVRDVDGISELGLPVFARGTHPATGSMDGPGALNVAIQCGGVAVNPGDIIRADSSGVVVIPYSAAETVLEATRAVAAREEGWRRAFESGASATEVLGADQLINRLSKGTDADAVP